MKGLNRMFLPLSGLLFCLSVSLRAQTAVSAFSLPAIPDSLKNPSSRASYLVAHYWDNFGFADSLQYMNAPVEIEHRLVPSGSGRGGGAIFNPGHAASGRDKERSLFLLQCL